MKKIAVILSGCGVYDGSEIHEAVLSLLAIEQEGASWHCFAPDLEQYHVINHLSGDEMTEKRNVLVEAARIARGSIQDITELKVDEYDALLVPGGFGAAKNLSDFAEKGAACSVEQGVEQACKAFADAGKPAGYLCIAPVLIPHIYPTGAKGTIGTDKGTAELFNTMGGQHVDCKVEDVVYDEANLLLTSPAYMLAENLSQAASGINKLVSSLVRLA